MCSRFAASLLVLVTALAGCASSAWRDAREADSIHAYHRFLRDYPDTSFSAEAKARLEMARIRKKPTREAYESFRHRFPDPALAAELLPHVEQSYFRHARAVGTAAAYRDFLAQFPDGELAKRAAGNAEYLASDGYAGDVSALAEFAKRHPESDYAREASRSVRAVEDRARTGFHRVGLVLEIDAATPGRDRVWRALRDRVVAAYGAAGLEVVRLDTPASATAAGVGAVLRLRHVERETSTEVEGTLFTEPSILARTEVTLVRVGEPEPIWSDAFQFRAPVSARRDDLSVLFSPGSQATYWAELDGQFFVPVARWATQLAARQPLSFDKPVVALEVSGQRAVVLHNDGDFQIFDLSDPANPVSLGRYERKRDLASFDGVTLAGSHVAIFGMDGIEIVRLDGEETRREAVFGRETVGSVAALERMGSHWIAATNRGLLRLTDGSTEIETLVEREIFGLARLGERLFFTNGISLYAARLPQLAAGRVDAELRLGRGFGPRDVRLHGSSAVVLGERDSVWVDLRGREPRLLSRIGGGESGRVRDAAVVAGRLFLLGSRGLQVIDGGGERVVDSVDVAARDHIDVSGRHLVMVGEKSLQVVDATPFVASPPAARR